MYSAFGVEHGDDVSKADLIKPFRMVGRALSRGKKPTPVNADGFKKPGPEAREIGRMIRAQRAEQMAKPPSVPKWVENPEAAAATRAQNKKYQREAMQRLGERQARISGIRVR